MHIILGILGTIITVLILFNRLKESGFDIGWLNPFSWAHRRRWRKKYHADPTFSIQSPMEATAGLMFVAAKCSGEISTEEKSFLIKTFQEDFGLTNNQATDLLSSCSFILKDEDNIVAKLKKYLEPSIKEFSTDQKQSALSLVIKTVDLSNPATQKQQNFVNELKNILQNQTNQKSW